MAPPDPHTGSGSGSGVQDAIAVIAAAGAGAGAAAPAAVAIVATGPVAMAAECLLLAPFQALRHHAPAGELSDDADLGLSTAFVTGQQLCHPHPRASSSYSCHCRYHCQCRACHVWLGPMWRLIPPM